jgi:hypothetical protein
MRWDISDPREAPSAPLKAENKIGTNIDRWCARV